MDYIKRPEKVTPYNTGKVEIGKHYVRQPSTARVSADMEDLQSALLGNRRILKDTVVTWAGVAFAIFVICMDLFIWRP